MNKKLLKKIQELTKKDLKYKSIAELYLSAGEEFGELGRAIKVEEKVYGNKHKTLDEPALSEAVDLLIMSLALYVGCGGDLESLPKILKRKLKKWQSNQKE